MKVDFQSPLSYESGFSKSTFIGNLVLTLRFVPQTVPRCSGASVLMKVDFGSPFFYESGFPQSVFL